jgi:hypothetical protein
MLDGEQSREENMTDKERIAQLEAELGQLKLALWCPLSLSCFLCGQGPLLPEQLAIRWRDSLLGICFSCRHAQQRITQLEGALKLCVSEIMQNMSLRNEYQDFDEALKHAQHALTPGDYREWCRDPKRCEDKNSCPNDPTCAD